MQNRHGITPGQLLVATPALDSGAFEKSVILITEHHDRGTIGFILNKPTTTTLDQLMNQRGISWADPHRIYSGGPVNIGALILLHTDEWYSSNTMQVGSEMAISSDTFMFEKISTNNVPRQMRFMQGMSVWAHGQLEHEIDQNSWLTCWPKDNIIFKYTGSAQWRHALEQCATQSVAQYF